MDIVIPSLAGASSNPFLRQATDYFKPEALTLAADYGEVLPLLRSLLKSVDPQWSELTEQCGALLRAGAEFTLRLSKYDAKGADAAERLKADPQLADLYQIGLRRQEAMMLKGKVEAAIQAGKSKIPEASLPDEVSQVKDPQLLPLFLNFRLSWEFTPESLVDAVELQAANYKECLLRGQGELERLCCGLVDAQEAWQPWHANLPGAATFETVLESGLAQSCAG